MPFSQCLVGESQKGEEKAKRESVCVWILRRQIFLIDSFRPSLPLTFLTSELAFADDKETDAFLMKHEANIYIATSSSSSPSITKESNAGKRKRSTIVPLSEQQWDAKASQAVLQAARDKLRLVDVSFCLLLFYLVKNLAC